MVAHLGGAGVNNALFREYARAPKGKKVCEDIPGKKVRGLVCFSLHLKLVLEGVTRNYLINASWYRNSDG